MYDCTWWDSQKIALPKHWAEIRKRLPYPSLWCRGLMPGIATDHPQYEYGEGSIVRTGLWLSQPKICAQGLFVGTDASGGPGSKDPRTRIVTWSVIAGSWGPEGFVSLGSLSGVEPPGTSVIQAWRSSLRTPKAKPRWRWIPKVLSHSRSPRCRKATIIRPGTVASLTEEGSPVTG